MCSGAMLLISHSAHAATYNVKNAPYNATGNGTTDDWNAIQNAVNDAINAGSGNTVYIPAGNYLLNSSISINIDHANGLTVQGDPGTTLLNGKTNDLMRVTNSSNVTITNITGDAASLWFTQGTITAVSGNTATVSVDSGYPAANRSDFSTQIAAGQQSLRIWSDPAWPNYDNTLQPVITGVTPSGGNYIFNLDSPLDPSMIGKKWAIWNFAGGWGIVTFFNTGPVNITNFRWYGGGAGPGLGISKNSGTTTITDTYIGPPPGSNRLVTAIGGIGVQGNRGAITIDRLNEQQVDDDVIDCGTDLAHITGHPSANVITTPSNDGNILGYYMGDTVQI